jgi:DNA (cytosine-5)-methyltransferase 1
VSKKKSLGRETGFRDKTQGTLFFDVADIISRHRPKAFFLENVKNLVSHDKGNTFRVIRETLEELDYSIHYRVMDGQEYVPQHRERIMIVGFNRRLFNGNERFVFPETTGVKHKLSDILEESPDAKYTLSDKLWRYLQNYALKHQEKGNGFGFGMASLNGVTRTLSARYYKDGSEILIPQGKGKNPHSEGERVALQESVHSYIRLSGRPQQGNQSQDRGVRRGSGHRIVEGRQNEGRDSVVLRKVGAQDIPFGNAFRD